MKKAPICNIKGCKKACHVSGKKSDGSPRYRKVCGYHHFTKIANNNGFKTITAWQNSFHPYRKHRVEYCENRDGRLGFKCRLIHRVVYSRDPKSGEAWWDPCCFRNVPESRRIDKPLIC